MNNNDGHDIIVIGASMGGIEALTHLFSQLPAEFPASLFVVLHLHPTSPSVLDRILGRNAAIPVRFAEDGAVPRPGTVYLAPPDKHLLLEEKRMVLSHGPRENRFRPAIDPLFRSAAAAHTSRVVGVVLTGLLDDGTSGLQAIQECGGITVVQDPADAAFPEMPRNAMNAVEVDHCVALNHMGKLLVELMSQPAPPALPVPEMLQKEVSMSKGRIDPKIEENILGQLVPFVCPDCGGSLSEITEGDVVRYRCHEGHAYTALSFLDAQWERVEYSLWAAIRVMEEQASMLRKLAERHGYNKSALGKGYEERALELQQHAQHLKDYLLTASQEAG